MENKVTPKNANYFLLALVMICSNEVFAQILIGPVVGGNTSWINIHDKGYRDEYSTRTSFGFHAGASVSFRMTKQIFLQGALLYSQKGKRLIGRKDKQFSNIARYNFIDLPISFTREIKMKIGDNRFYNLYFGVGPTLSYWLGGKGTLSSSDLNENLINPPSYDVHYKVTFNKSADEIALGELNVRDANRLMLGLNFSAGVVLEPARLNKIMFTVRYELGHSYFSKDEDGDFGLSGIVFYKDDMQSRTQAVSASLFYFIDLNTAEKNKGKSTIDINKINQKKRR